MLQDWEEENADIHHQVELKISGVVQGVGFRPHAYKVAHGLELSGRIKNCGDHVRLLLKGPLFKLKQFIPLLKKNLPSHSRIHGIEENWMPTDSLKGLFIEDSETRELEHISIPADLVTCKECLDEFHQENHRMHRYPFIACTHCGPRYSLVQDLPYDRSRTSMEAFPLCKDCQKDFNNPESRRFHAQNTSCPKCGPQLKLLDGEGNEVDYQIEDIATLLKEGVILAVKGIGGFQLVCDASNSQTINLLRMKKHRPHQAMAVMVREIEILDESAEKLNRLQDPTGPIILTENHYGLPQNLIAPDTNKIGLFLPSSALHQLLFGVEREKKLNFLVVTSGNEHGEPMETENKEAIRKLKGIADYFLVHNREIVRSVDDSVCSDGPIRLGRGFTSQSFQWNSHQRILGMGGDLKNTFSLSHHQRIYLSPHMGNLHHSKTFQHYEKSLLDFMNFHQCRPEKIMIDGHPEYYSSQLGKMLAQEYGVPVEKVQHHVAHGAGLLFENNIQEAMVLAWDGTGYGEDETLWGGECLSINLNQKKWERTASLELSSLLGNEKAIIEPRRQSYARLREAGVNLPSSYEILFSKKEMFSKTSSVGRLFDSVSAMLLPQYQSISYEGQAAMGLEALASKGRKGRCYPLGWNGLRVNTSLLFIHLYQDMKAGIPKEEIALGFHQSLGRLALLMAERTESQTGLSRVGLSGGVFQNQLLSKIVIDVLTKKGFEVFTHKSIPPNDGGLSLGQAVWGGLSHVPCGGTSNA